MIRLFASDMDGTLLNDKGYISDRTINAVKKFTETWNSLYCKYWKGLSRCQKRT